MDKYISCHFAQCFQQFCFLQLLLSQETLKLGPSEKLDIWQRLTYTQPVLNQLMNKTILSPP